jgi:hypothetical protein
MFAVLDRRRQDERSELKVSKQSPNLICSTFFREWNFFVNHSKNRKFPTCEFIKVKPSCNPWYFNFGIPATGRDPEPVRVTSQSQNSYTKLHFHIVLACLLLFQKFAYQISVFFSATCWSPRNIVTSIILTILSSEFVFSPTLSPFDLRTLLSILFLKFVIHIYS